MGRWSYNKPKYGVAELRWRNGLRIYFLKLSERSMGEEKMTKRNVSRGQKFSLKSMPIRKLRNKRGVRTFQASKRLRSKNYVKKILFDCFCHNDMEAFKEVLKAHFELQNKNKIIKKTGMSKATFYRTISKKSNPTLKNISKLLEAV